MPKARTPSKWPYRAAKPIRSRVVRAKDAPVRGVRRREEPEPLWRITRLQARLGLAGAMLVLLLSVGWWGYHSPYLTVNEVEVTGASQLTAQAIVDAAGITGDSVFSLDLEAAQARVAALPKVRSASVEKHGWTGVAIHVEERTPWGSWQIDGVNVPIDIDGYVLDGAAAPDGSPVILEIAREGAVNAGDRVDPGAVELASRLVNEADTAFGRRVLALIYRQNAGITAVLSSQEIDGKPIWVTFGDSRDYDYKVAALYVLLEAAKDNDKALNAVDLRFGNRLSFN